MPMSLRFDVNEPAFVNQRAYVCELMSLRLLINEPAFCPEELRC